MKNKKCVYTVITNNYCDLNDNNIKSEGWDYICFTDNKNIKSNFWKIIFIENNSENRIQNIKLSKKYKTQGFKELVDYDTFLYIDGRISITQNINKYLESLNDYDILFMKHRQDNILVHMSNIEKLGYDSKEVIDTIRKRYEEYDYKYDNGLIEGGILLFRVNERVVNFFNDWWDEIHNYSIRDQLSANFALFLNPDLKYLINESHPMRGKHKYFKLLDRKNPRFKVK